MTNDTLMGQRCLTIIYLQVIQCVVEPWVAGCASQCQPLSDAVFSDIDHTTLIVPHLLPLHNCLVTSFFDREFDAESCWLQPIVEDMSQPPGAKRPFPRVPVSWSQWQSKPSKADREQNEAKPLEPTMRAKIASLVDAAREGALAHGAKRPCAEDRTFFDVPLTRAAKAAHDRACARSAGASTSAFVAHCDPGRMQAAAASPRGMRVPAGECRERSDSVPDDTPLATQKTSMPAEHHDRHLIPQVVSMVEQHLQGSFSLPLDIVDLLQLHLECIHTDLLNAIGIVLERCSTAKISAGSSNAGRASKSQSSCAPCVVDDDPDEDEEGEAEESNSNGQQPPPKRPRGTHRRGKKTISKAKKKGFPVGSAWNLLDQP